MATTSLKSKILLSCVTIIVVFSILMAMAGFIVIKKQVIDRAQAKVETYLNFAREVYQEQTRRVEDSVRFAAGRFFVKDAILKNDLSLLQTRINEIRQQENLDILTLVDKKGNVIIRSRNPFVIGDNQADDAIIKKVLTENIVLSATVTLTKNELALEGKDLVGQAHVKTISTPKAKPNSETDYDAGMMIKAAAPIKDYNGNLIGVLYGGNLLNKNFSIS